MTFLQNRDRRPQSIRKNDHIEQYAILDRCSQIIKDDRLLLRQQLKDGTQELVALFTQHKTKPDLHILQLDLRKYLNKMKGKFQQSQQHQQKPQKENNASSQQHSFLAHYNRIEQKLPLQDGPLKNPLQRLNRKLEQPSIQNIQNIQNNQNSQNTLKKQLSPTAFRSPEVKSKPTLSPMQTAQKPQKPTKSATKIAPPTQLSFRPQTKLKQEFSPRFNTNQIALDEMNETSIPQNDLSEFLNQKEIENSRTQLEIFELKINEYSKGNTIQNLWTNECNSQQQSPIGSRVVHRRTDTSILENLNKQSQPKNFGQNLRFQNQLDQFNQQSDQMECEDYEDGAQKDEVNFETFNATKKDAKFNCVLASFQNLGQQVRDYQDKAISRLQTSHSNILDQEQSSQKQMNLELQSTLNSQFKIDCPENHYFQEDLGKKIPQWQDRQIQDCYLEKQFEQSQSMIINPQLSSHKKYNNLMTQKPLMNESYIRKIEINEDDIMKKYADLFTAPEFLQQCKNSIQSFQSEAQYQQTEYSVQFSTQTLQNEYSSSVVQSQQQSEVKKPTIEEYNYDSVITKPQHNQQNQQNYAEHLNWNFMVPCQSVVYQNTNVPQVETQNWDYLNENRCLQVSQIEVKKPTNEQDKWITLLQGIEQYTPEQIFDEIFSENSLNKISRAFFRFKMEGLVQSFQQNESQMTTQTFDELFQIIDSKQDGFVDVNEMGQYLMTLCPEEDNNLIRIIFELLDQDQKGFFNKQDLDDYLAQIQENCEVSNIDNLKELSKIFFNECDLLSTNAFTYWEFYLKKTTDSSQRIIDVIADYVEQIQRLQQ